MKASPARGLAHLALVERRAAGHRAIFQHVLRRTGRSSKTPICSRPERKPRPRSSLPISSSPAGTSNVEVSIRTDLNNNWAYFNFALINEDTGQDFDFGREVSYYRDSDGSEGESERFRDHPARSLREVLS